MSEHDELLELLAWVHQDDARTHYGSLKNCQHQLTRLATWRNVRAAPLSADIRQHIDDKLDRLTELMEKHGR